MKKIFKFRSIRTKMLFGFSLVLALLVILASFNLFTIKQSNDGSKEIIDEQLPTLINGSNLSYNTAHSLALARGYVLFGSNDFKEEFAQYTNLNQEIREDILKVNDADEVKQLFDQLDEWREIIENEVFLPYDQGDEEQAKEALRTKVVPLSEEVLGTLERLTTERADTITSIGTDNLSAGEKALLFGIGISILAILIGIIAAILTANSIASPIRIVMDRMRLIADGDLSNEPLQTKLADEVGQLVIATNEMNDKMRSLLHQVSEVSETVSSQSEELTQAANEVSEGAAQISSTMQELASGSETQANSASELSNVMGIFATKISEANENGQNIQESSNEVLEMTSEGYQLMEQSTTQMNGINKMVREAVEDVQGLDDQSQKISELVHVIEDIAEQTNLLALNAAIEAARAGEHGQGFAVVADEVRKLAEGVSESVTDITEIVTDIQQETKNVTDSLRDGYSEVEQGTNQIAETGETFNEISAAVEDMVKNIRTVTDNLTDIAGESDQMNSSIQEIAAVSEESAAGVEQTTASAQQTTSAMEEITASSNDLATLAEELNGLVQQFRL